jgi:hypothetical protein
MRALIRSESLVLLITRLPRFVFPVSCALFCISRFVQVVSVDTLFN